MAKGEIAQVCHKVACCRCIQMLQHDGKVLHKLVKLVHIPSLKHTSITTNFFQEVDSIKLEIEEMKKEITSYEEQLKTVEETIKQYEVQVEEVQVKADEAKVLAPCFIH